MGLLKFPAVVCLFFILVVPKDSVQEADQVVCYYASWATYRSGNGKFTPEDINPLLCTQVNYAFVGLLRNGSLQIGDYENDVVQQGFRRVSNLKQKNPKLKVLFSIGGTAADPSVFSEVSMHPEKMQTMAKEALALIKEYNFDGVDVDWEYPNGGNHNSYIDLLKTLKAALQPHNYLVTVAVNSIPGEVYGGYDIPAMSKVLDYIHVMTYDFHPPTGPTAQNAPLFGGDFESNWQRENRNGDAAIRQWIAGGADPKKLTIGAGFYGHTFTLANPSDHGYGAPSNGPGAPGPYTANQGSLGYNEICEFHSKGTEVFQEDMKVPYRYDGNLWVGYDNERSVTYKAEYAQKNGLAGVMVWSIETDDMHGFCGETNGLLKAINKQLGRL